MANTIRSNGTITINTAALQLINDFSFSSRTLTGSNAVSSADNITTQSYQALNTSSLSDIRYFIASNQDLTGSISIATDNVGTNQIGYLGKGDFILIPWSGSTQLWAKAFKTTGSALLEYSIVEA